MQRALLMTTMVWTSVGLSNVRVAIEVLSVKFPNCVVDVERVHLSRFVRFYLCERQYRYSKMLELDAETFASRHLSTRDIECLLDHALASATSVAG